MLNTTLCYLEKDGKYLMLHRVKKENDVNRDKWIGIGGKFEQGESPEECAKREIFEETGLYANTLCYRAIITFVSDITGTEYMHLFTCKDFEGDMKSVCDEGVLEWVKKQDVALLPIWEGDKIFLSEISKDTCNFFSLKLCYEGDRLVDSILQKY